MQQTDHDAHHGPAGPADGFHRDVAALKAAMTASWDRGADTYDNQWGHGLQTATERDAWLGLLTRLIPVSGAPQRVLDVGSGTGFLALLLADLGHDVVGLDLSEAMLDRGRQAAQRRTAAPSTTGSTGAVNFVVGDAESPPPGLGTFDVVVSRHVLWTLQQPELAVSAWAQMLNPAGRIIVVDGFWLPRTPADRLAMTAGRLLQRLQGEGAEHHGYPAQTRGRLPLQRQHSLNPIRNVFTRAGLVDVLAEELTWLDDVERDVAPLARRLQLRYRRYLIEGRRRD